MRLSSEGLAFLSHEEGLRTAPYQDAGGRWTIGVGHLITDSELSSGVINIGGVLIPWRPGLTLPQVQQLLAQDCAPREDALARIVVCPLNDNEFAALFSLYFNAQPKPDSGLFQTINGGDWTDLETHWKTYNHVNGVVDQELVGRRAREWNLWNEPAGG